MIGQLEASIVRILDATGVVAGAGFLVSGRHVLTCAHVVARALGLTETSTGMPEAEVTLDFPLVAKGTTVRARTILWKPASSGLSSSPNGAEDIAGLEFVEQAPTPSRYCRLMTSADLWGHGFRAFGFPSRRDDGVWATGVLRGRQGAGWIQIEDLKDAGYRVEPGFSGAPVWDEALDGVVGMAVAADEQPGVRAAFIIPTETLVAAWPALGTQAIPPCPYRGLFAFREEDAALFFGRDSVAEALAEAVQQRRLVAVLGASGSGKSSVVFAGLIPRLRAEGTLNIVSCRPGTHPFLSLAAGLTTALEPQMSEVDRMLEVQKLAEALRQSDLAVTDIARRVLEKTGFARFLLVVDQFEELYTLLEDSKERALFLDRLLACLHAAELCLVLTMRADFLGQALSYRPFADALQQADLKLGPMNRQEFQDAVERPAHALGVGIEEGLTTRILDAVAEEPGNLPLLEFTLTLLWARRERGLLTHSAYETMGGVEGALAGYAEDVYRQLDDEHKQRMQRLLVQLVHPGEGAQDARRLATSDEVGEETWDLVARLADARLVITGQEGQGGAETVEIAHEALIAKWDRLHGWIEVDRAFRLWQERLRSAMRQWEATGRDEGALVRGALLAEATDWRASRGRDLSGAENAFIEASVAATQEDERIREAARQWELAQAQALADEQSRRAAEQAKHAKRRGRQARALGLALVVVLLGITYQTAKLPPVRGLSLATAQKVLLDAGFKPNAVQDEPNAELNQGLVLSAVPQKAPGFLGRVLKGPITIVRSKGIEIPKVDPEQTAAANTLAGAGFTVPLTPRVVADKAPAGTVVGTDPPVQQFVSAGTPVTLLVSSGIPQLAVNPPNLTMPSQPVGSASEPQTVTVANAGSGPLTIASVVPGGANASDFTVTSNTCATVQPQLSCTVLVTFTPGAAGPRVGTLTISSDAPIDIPPVTLFGIGSKRCEIQPRFPDCRRSS